MRCRHPASDLGDNARQPTGARAGDASPPRAPGVRSWSRFPHPSAHQQTFEPLASSWCRDLRPPLHGAHAGENSESARPKGAQARRSAGTRILGNPLRIDERLTPRVPASPAAHTAHTAAPVLNSGNEGYTCKRGTQDQDLVTAATGLLPCRSVRAPWPCRRQPLCFSDTLHAWVASMSIAERLCELRTARARHKNDKTRGRAIPARFRLSLRPQPPFTSPSPVPARQEASVPAP